MKVTSGDTFEIDLLGHSFPILWHVVLIGLGFLAGLLLLLQTRKRYGYTTRQCLHMIAIAAVGGIWGSRFFYCAVHWTSFVENCRARGKSPLLQLFIPVHGMTLQGGLWGSVLLFYLYCRWNNLSFARMGDFGVSPLSLGVCFGRVGCLFNGCCFGKAMESAVTAAAAEASGSSVWSQWYHYFMSTEYLLSAYPTMRRIQGRRSSRVSLQHDDHGELTNTHIHYTDFTDPLYATQLYAAIGNLLLCIILYEVGKRQWLSGHGQLFGLYWILYSFLRLFVELYRDRPMPSDKLFESSVWQNIYEAHIVCVLSIVFGSVYLWRTRQCGSSEQMSRDKANKTI